MKKMVNATKIVGLLYQHSLELKTVANKDSKNFGTEYITGTVEVATDDALTNIVPVHFSYTTATTSKGSTNNTFIVLKNIIDKVYKSCMEHGADVATKLKIDSAIDLNEFYSDKTGKEEFVSVKRNEGGFIHVISNYEDNDMDETKRNRFDTDIVITNVRHVDADEEKNTKEKAIVKGCIFNFRKEMLPVEFTVINPGAIAYFEDLGATGKNPVFTRVKGAQIAESVVRTVEEESAFGTTDVRTYKNNRKDFVIDWAAKEPYEWDSEETILASELANAIKAREILLATKKQKSDEWKASRDNVISTTTAAPASGDFDF